MADLEDLQEPFVVDEVTKAKLAQAKGEEYEAPPEEKPPEDDEDKQVQQIDFEARLQEMERHNQEMQKQYQEQMNQQNMVVQQQLAQMMENVNRQATPPKAEPDFPVEEELDLDIDDNDDGGVNRKIASFLTKSQKQNLKMFNALQAKLKEQAETTEQRNAEMQEQFKYGWQLNFEREFKKNVQDLINAEEVFHPLGDAKRHIVTEVMQKVRYDPEFQGMDNVNELAVRHVKSEATRFKKDADERKAKSGAKKVKQKTTEQLPPSSRGGASLPPGMEGISPEKLATHRQRMKDDPAYRKEQSLAYLHGTSPQKG